MKLFGRYGLALEEAEKTLKWPLTGDPSRGEHAVLAALNGTRLEDARRILDRDSSIKEDFRELVEARLRSALRRAGEVKSWSVGLPLPLWDEYAKQARLANIPIGECLAAAIQRDHERQRVALDAVGVLDEHILAYHRATAQLVEEVRQLVQRLGSIQELSARVGRIEAALNRAST